MIKKCVVCGEDFEANGGNAKYCSQTCRYLRYKSEDHKGKDRINAIQKFVYHMFDKNSERTQKLKNGEYNLWDIYSSYLYYLDSKYQDKADILRIHNESLFADLFIDAIKRKKRISLKIVSSSFQGELMPCHYQFNRSFLQYLGDPLEHKISKYLPAGEDYIYIAESSRKYQNFELAREQYIDEEDLTSDIKEQQFELLFVKTVNQANGICWKLAASSPGCSGVPDRVVVFPCGKFGFVELKRPYSNEQPRPNQVKQLNKALQLTNHVYVLSDPELVSEVIQDIQFDTYPETRYTKQ